MRFTRAFTAALAALFAAGCSGGDGGGGGGKGGEPPVADAGDDADARLFQSYTLDGSQSADPEGKDLAFAWSVLSAPDGSVVTLTSSGAAAMTSFTPDTEGIYLFGLVVSDGKKISTLDTVEVRVELRVAVFADPEGELAREIELYGAGQVDDFYGWPDSYVVAAAGDVAILRDLRDRRQTLIAYRAAAGTQELLVSAESLAEVGAAGDHVVWLEERDGQNDLFTRDLLTGEEIRITNDEFVEALGEVTPDFVTFHTVNSPYGYDVFVYDFASHGLTNLSDMDLGIDDQVPRTDGTTIVYTSADSTFDAFAYDLTTQTTIPIGTATTANEIALGVSGDFAIFVMSTGGNFTLYRHQLSTGTNTPIEQGIADFSDVDGDYAVYSAGSELRAYRLSTNTVSVVSTNWDDVSLLNGVVAWTEYNPGTDSYDVKYRTLPAGAVTTIANSGDANDVRVLDSGIAWDAHPGNYVFDSFYSADGGVTTDLASSGKVFLTDRLAEYDVAIIGGDIDSDFGTDTIDALSAAGVPLLSFDRTGSALLNYVSGDYALNYSSEDCGDAALRFNNSAHPAFAGFPAGSYAAIDTPDIDADTETYWIEPDDLALPADWFVLATYDVSSSCPYDAKDAIATFTNDDGVAVILDGSATTFVPLWSAARRDLVISELRYLASTRAP